MSERRDSNKRFTLFWDFTTGGKQYRWRLRDDTGATLAFSPRKYANKQECEADMALAKTRYPDVPIVDLTKSLS